MIESEVTIHIVEGRLWIFINGEKWVRKHYSKPLLAIEEAVSITEFEPFRGRQEPINLIDAVIDEVINYDGLIRELRHRNEMVVHLRNLQRKIIACIPIFNWMLENQNQISKLGDGDIELIEMGDLTSLSWPSEPTWQISKEDY